MQGQECHRTCGAGQREARQVKMVDSLSEGKGEAWLLCCLCKVLVLDGEIADGEYVIGNEPLHGTGSILDLELGAIGLVR